jgi:methionine sulfoxide reductase heme-binding subunit
MTFAAPKRLGPRGWAAVHLLVCALALLPLAYTAWQLGTQPVHEPTQVLQRASGRWALRLLVLTLCVSPLRVWTGFDGLMRVRRTLGLLAFAHAAVHVLTYLWLDMGWDWRDIVFDVPKRPYVVLGLLAFALLAPLAATSTNRARRALGAAWQRLHRLVYPAALLAVLHFALLTKDDWLSPLAHAAALAVLLGWRVQRRRVREAGRPR